MEWNGECGVDKEKEEEKEERHTKSVKPAYTSREVAVTKSFCTIAQPKMGHAIILETVKRFGMVYMFSLSVAGRIFGFDSGSGGDGF